MIVTGAQLSDVLSPMLVKELRQELRTRAFVNVFVWFQAVLFISVLVSLGSAGDVGVSSLGGAIFWIAAGFPILIMVPRQASASFNKEVDAEELDLVLLTGLSGWKVVAGKWVTAALQSTLFLVAVLPYAVLRYYIGHVNFIENVQILLIVYFISLLLSAVALGLSVSKEGKAPKGALFFIGGGILLLVMNSLVGIGYYVSSIGIFSSVFSNLLIIIFYGALIVLYMLELGAGKIAPRLKNHKWS